MIDRVIEWSLRNRLVVVGLTLLVCVFGVRAMVTLPVDAIPDLSENQVIVSADWPGRSPQEVETLVTHPLTLSLQGIAGTKTVRGTSMFGFSLIHVIFEDGADRTLARQRVNEKLSSAKRLLPVEVDVALGPDATGLGWVFQYYLAVDTTKGRFDLGELRTLQDTVIRPQLSSVSGVAEVGSVGGFVKQYQIEIDSAMLRAAGVTMKMLLEAVSESNLSVGGKTIEENGMEFVVRGAGLLRNSNDIEKIVVMDKPNARVLLRDVARVEMGGDFRRGVLDVGGSEVVGGIVVVRSGENARDVIERVKAKITQLQPSLPEGIVITPFYDRSELIDRSLDTLKRALIEEIILVILAHIVFLWHFRSILIVTLPLPISILASFLVMKALGVTSNIMSLAGIAIAIGVLVDGAIVMTENVLRRASKVVQGFSSHSDGTTGDSESLASTERDGLKPITTLAVLDAAKQVGRPIFFAMAIIILAFVPVFALTGQEGKLFHPLALAKTCAMLAAAVLSVTLVPALCATLIRGRVMSEAQNIIMRWLLRVYDPVLDFALKHTRIVLSSVGLVLAVAVGLARTLGSEFMPPLKEGSLLFMPTFAPGTSLTEVKRVMAWQDQVFASTPEIQSAVGKLGRADTATDPAPTEMIETTITLKPESQWRVGMTQDKLIADLSARLQQVPGSLPGFIQPIEGRVLMLSTGIRAQLGVKLFGDDLDTLQKWALEVQRVLHEVRGASGVTASRVQGRPYVTIEPDRDSLARASLRVSDVMAVIETGISGKEATTVTEGRAQVPVQVRLQRSEREDIERLRNLIVAKGIPLGQLATIKRSEGPNEIASEDGQFRAFVQANVEERDLTSFVEEVKSRIARDIEPHLPKGLTISYSGDYEHQLHAASTLRWIVPCVLLVIFLLLVQVYGSAKEAAHVLLAVPFALSGGALLQWAMGIPFSVAVWVGYIALFGTAIQTSIVMVVYLNEAFDRMKQSRGDDFTLADLIQATKNGARLRLRPKVMTVATIVCSLLPMLWSTSTGAEVMKPIAVPVIGGMLSSLLHILIVTPVIFVWLRRDATRA
jgi:Cu(I)/Ag(I) efflux system membrane protein CusA/SilA